ncbi:MAG: hypothetical protein ACPGYP_09860, partial [Solirubrobacterales bacterium]
MRIASLVPSATELLFALGLGDDVVAVTHECDFPPEAIDLPQLTASVIPAGLAPAEIDQRVRAQTTEGLSLYTLDEELLAEEEPDLIVAQQLCDAGLWYDAGNAFIVNDYLDHNPPREKVLAQREKERVKKARGRANQGRSSRGQFTGESLGDTDGDTEGDSHR